MRMWWQYALWGLGGAAVNRALIGAEAAQRVKGLPWPKPEGPGGGVYLVSVIIQLAVATVVVAAAAQSKWVPNPGVALGMGASAPVLLKKLTSIALALVGQG